MEVEQLKVKLIQTEEDHRDVLGPMEQVNTSLKASLQEALEEVQVKTTQLMECTEQLDYFKEQVYNFMIL